ncbi:MAG TPA: EVE domain-containing protein [Dysgonamonadaceae bacterium]|nr:EVE domain-containing protein [Dysgonamonadaceae bacterium]
MNKEKLFNETILNNDPVQLMIDDYKKLIQKKQLQDEKYKWELLDKYKGRPNLDAEDLLEEVKDIKYDNLMYPMAKAVLYRLAGEKAKELSELFTQLFDDKRDLSERVKVFSKESLVLYKEIEGKHSHHQDERSISTYLTFHNPEKYTFYKYSYYNSYCKLLGIKKAKINERYAHYLSLIDDLVEKYIKPDNELIEQVKSYVPQYYDGTNHKLLAQDVLFQTENMSAMVNYWIFQGNPKQFDFESAMKEEAVETWTVTAHKSAIKEGDKVIIWITGENAGCYALAEVTSKPYEKTSAKDDKYWMEENKNNEVVDIKITHNIVDYPLLKDEIDAEKELTNLKVGNQGTNFAATKEEYEKLLELAMNREDKRYWLYSPGEQAQNWEEFYNNEIMGLGWDELVDLKSYKSKDEIKEALDKAYGGDGSKKNDTTANDEFANVMQAGDIVIAKKGWYELLGYGLVTSDYIFDETRKEYKHIRKMDWKLNGNWYIEDQMVPKTLTDITPYETEDPDYDTYYERLLGVMGVNENGPDDSQFFEIKSKFDSEYGPTLFQNFINYLRKIISELDLKPNDERIVYSIRHNRLNFIIGQRYCFNIHLKHPNGVYGFISNEKLYDNSDPFKGKPKAYYNNIDDFNLTGEEWNSLIDTMRRELNKVVKAGFRKHNNVDFENYLFKIDTPPNGNGKMMIPTNTILYGPPGTGKTYNTINEALKIIDNDFLKEHINNREKLNKRFRGLRFNPETGEGQIAFITFHQSLSYEDFIEGIKPVKSDAEESVRYEVCDGLFKSIAKKASDKRVVVSFDDIYKQFIGDVMEKEKFSLKTPVQKKPFNVRINGSGNCVAVPQTETATQMVVTKQMIQDYLIDGTIRDWKPYLSSIAEYIKANYDYRIDKEDNTHKPYVIIIDEINRGNISQIFGELITLIEPDKRKGQTEEIEVILPYSKERFSVPSNLYIIGTMNTADRSVEALDTALRRRFSFVEMNPKPEMLSLDEFKCADINLEVMLSKINDRLEKLLDKDYCIGHSYFMTIKNKQEPLEELKLIFQNKILPLLQEYFYGDWGKIRLVVGKKFVEKKENGVDFLDADNQEDIEEFDSKLIYNFTMPLGWTLDTFKTIYEKTE